MSTGALQVVDVTAPEAVERTAEVLLAGGVAVVPTDTVYGLAALAGNSAAVDRLYGLKARSEAQPFAVLVSDSEQALGLAEDPGVRVVRWMESFWPGPLTIVMDRASRVRHLDLGGDSSTIGIRCPDSDFLRELIDEVGPLATTSANRSGLPTPATASEAAASLAAPVDLVVDGGPVGTLASTVVDVSGNRERVLRIGAITEDQLF